MENRRQYLSELIFTRNAHQRIRIAQCGVAALFSLASLLNTHYLVWAGLAPLEPVAWLNATMVAGFAIFFGIIRSGVNLRFADPSLTVPQMLFAIVCCATAYALTGAGRGGAFQALMLIFMFGMYALQPVSMRWISLFAVVVFGATMALMAKTSPERL